MAIPRIKTTYSLPVDTVAALDRLAARWAVSRSQALARAVAAADESEPPSDALVALDAWQAALQLGPEQAAAWERRARDERLARDLGGRTADHPRSRARG